MLERQTRPMKSIADRRGNTYDQIRALLLRPCQCTAVINEPIRRWAALPNAGLSRRAVSVSMMGHHPHMRVRCPLPTGTCSVAIIAQPVSNIKIHDHAGVRGSPTGMSDVDGSGCVAFSVPSGIPGVECTHSLAFVTHSFLFS